MKGSKKSKIFVQNKYIIRLEKGPLQLFITEWFYEFYLWLSQKLKLDWLKILSKTLTCRAMDKKVSTIRRIEMFCLFPCWNTRPSRWRTHVVDFKEINNWLCIFSTFCFLTFKPWNIKNFKKHQQMMRNDEIVFCS